MLSHMIVFRLLLLENDSFQLQTRDWDYSKATVALYMIRGSDNSLLVPKTPKSNHPENRVAYSFSNR